MNYLRNTRPIFDFKEPKHIFLLSKATIYLFIYLQLSVSESTEPISIKIFRYPHPQVPISTKIMHIYSSASRCSFLLLKNSGTLSNFLQITQSEMCVTLGQKLHAAEIRYLLYCLFYFSSSSSSSSFSFLFCMCVIDMSNLRVYTLHPTELLRPTSKESRWPYDSV